MNKRYGLSAMGYAIASVIMLGIVMILSAPLILDSIDQPKNNKNKNKSISIDQSEVRKRVDIQRENDDLRAEIRELERRLDSRISDLENNNDEPYNGGDYSNGYFCTINGMLDEYGNVIPLNSTDVGSGVAKKFVFVCEYKR